MPTTLYTVGHSNHDIEKFIALLTKHAITAVADVRSQPFSRRNPQFNKARLAESLAQAGIAYVFVGRELGARSDDPACYEQDQVQYQRLAQTELFKSGLARVLTGAERFRVAIMCAEKEPLDCHRTLLVARALEARGVSIVHILADGSTETQAQTAARLIKSLRLADDLFGDYEQVESQAWKIREAKIAYVRPAQGSRTRA